MNVHWTENALADLDAARAVIARRSEPYAQAMAARMFARTDILEDQPFFGTVVPEFEDGSVQEVFEHPYRIIYRVLETQIDVVAVVHAARKLTRGNVGG